MLILFSTNNGNTFKHFNLKNLHVSKLCAAMYALLGCLLKKKKGVVVGKRQTAPSLWVWLMLIQLSKEKSFAG